jgi:hypothetical protein
LRSARNLNINGNAKTGVSDERLVLYVVFACYHYQLANAEILSTAQAGAQGVGLPDPT